MGISSGCHPGANAFRCTTSRRIEPDATHAKPPSSRRLGSFVRMSVVVRLKIRRPVRCVAIAQRHRRMQAFARALYNPRIGDRPVVLVTQAILPLAGLDDRTERIRARGDVADPEAT